VHFNFKGLNLILVMYQDWGSVLMMTNPILRRIWSFLEGTKGQRLIPSKFIELIWMLLLFYLVFKYLLYLFSMFFSEVLLPV
jgi:hypothetical protein